MNRIVSVSCCASISSKRRGEHNKKRGRRLRSKNLLRILLSVLKLSSILASLTLPTDLAS